MSARSGPGAETHVSRDGITLSPQAAARHEHADTKEDNPEIVYTYPIEYTGRFE